MNRRTFLTAATVAGASALVPSVASAAVAARRDASGNRIKLGIDNFAVRGWGWKGRELVDYAAGLKLDTLFITDLPALDSLEAKSASELRAYAADKGIEVLLGSWSICPTSKTFKKDWGTAEEHLALG
ncbi:MAG: sugar phosphate isomerase/epimerase, partial [Verrucomicrobiota bacterium]